jgi:alanyl-tRNA synthetase
MSLSTRQIREKYLAFFEKNGHKIIDPAPLVLENDPSTLFTSSGMQPLVPYLLGEPHPEGKRVCDSQPSIRVQDIEEVGNNRHTTFFEMLGNWSFGNYFKSDQIPWIWEFITDKKELGLPKEKLYVSIFEGNGIVPKDEESKKIWLNLGVPEDHIFEYDVKKNWWSRSGPPENMPPGEIGGPDSEIFYDFGEELKLHENSEWKDEECNPNCDCGRFMEIGNSVFIQYKKLEDGSLEELPQKNVDFGGGLERLEAATKNNPDVFEIEIFKDLISEIEINVRKKYEEDKPSFRIIADHVRAATFLARSGVVPSNKLQGYVMRRLIRRAVLKARKLKDNIIEPNIFTNIVAEIVNFEDTYFKKEDLNKLQGVIFDEVNKFAKTLEKGYREVNKIDKIDGKIAFDLYQTYGFPLELSIEIFKEKGQEIDTEEFKKAFELHQDKSRTASAGTFKGGLMDHSEETTRLHTATHLLHSALRKILGDHVQQKGSNITHERLRFDFTHNQKLTTEEIQKVQDLINQQIDKDFPVSFDTMSLEEARAQGALAFFDQKYASQVKVYTVGDPKGEFFSKEVCGGPHVNKLSDLKGHVTIIKEEASSVGVRRIYATIA